jgi:hypothetical protein
MNTHQQQAQSSLSQLVAHVFANQNGPIKGVTYQDLFLRLAILSSQERLPDVGHRFEALKGHSDFIAHRIKFFAGYSRAGFMRNESAKIFVLRF